MRVVRGYRRLSPGDAGCAATIGNFDGVHRGHQAVIRQLATKAESMQCPAVVITFEPQPQEYFAGEAAPARLTRLREKLAVMRELPLEQVVVLRFDRKLSSLSADAFIRDILIDALGVRHLIVGDDFRFGRGREGDHATLQAASVKYGFELEGLSTFVLDNERVSSTRIRDALVRGDMEAATALLGRPYTMCGRVIEGNQRGRTIGFPTANIALHRVASPVRGVFAVRVKGVGGQSLTGVANLGTRPTVDGVSRPLLEVHVFDFESDIYGRRLAVEFCHRLRDEQRFDSFDALRAQIDKDASDAREYFKNRES